MGVLGEDSRGNSCKSCRIFPGDTVWVNNAGATDLAQSWKCRFYICCDDIDLQPPVGGTT